MNQRLKKPLPSSRAFKKIRRLPPRPVYRWGHRSSCNSFQTVTSKIASCQTRPLTCWMKLVLRWTWPELCGSKSDRSALDWSWKPQSSSDTRGRLWKAAYFRDQIAKYKGNARKQGPDQDTLSLVRKPSNILLSRKPIFPVGEFKEKNSLNSSI